MYSITLFFHCILMQEFPRFYLYVCVCARVWEPVSMHWSFQVWKRIFRGRAFHLSLKSCLNTSLSSFINSTINCTWLLSQLKINCSLLLPPACPAGEVCVCWSSTTCTRCNRCKIEHQVTVIPFALQQKEVKEQWTKRPEEGSRVKIFIINCNKQL